MSAAASITAVWLGTAGLYLSDGKNDLLIDPFVSRYGKFHVLMGRDVPSKPEVVDEWIRKLGVRPGTPVIITHSHYDHALDAPTFARKLDSEIVGSQSTAFIGIGAGLPREKMRVVEMGSSFQAGDFRVTFRESCHGKYLGMIESFKGQIGAPLKAPARASAYRTGKVFSVLVEHPGGTFLHHPSPCVNPDTIAPGMRAGTVFLGLAGRPSFTETTSSMIDPLGAKRVVPIHWDDFFEPLVEEPPALIGVSPDSFSRDLREQRPDLQEVKLKVGERWIAPRD